MKTFPRICLSGDWRRSIQGAFVDYVKVPGSYRPVGQCLLERTFDAGELANADGRLFLVTEGVLAKTEFTLNGQSIGVAGPWTTYRFELPPGLLRPRGNVIQACVRDIIETFGPMPGRRFDGGLVRPIYIERRPAAFLENFNCTSELSADFSSVRVTVTPQINGSVKGNVTATLAFAPSPGTPGEGRGGGNFPSGEKTPTLPSPGVPGEGKKEQTPAGHVVATASSPIGRPIVFDLTWPQLWSPESPTRYSLSVSLSESDDEVNEDIGFRKLEVRGRDFYLNDQRLLLKGVCRHEFNEISGYSPSEAEVRTELTRIKHAGFNYIRLVHSPQAAMVPRICAEIGLLVSEEPGACFHDLADEAVAGPSVESMRRTVLRDRNVPSILGWLIYNECNPNSAYAVRVAKMVRELNPGCLVGVADCSGQDDNIHAMADAAGLDFYGINIYDFWPHTYSNRAKKYVDRPLVISEWGGWWGQGNTRVLKSLCDEFVTLSREGNEPRIAGSSFWVWADWEERSRGGIASPDGYTIEGLVDIHGNAKPDLAILSQMCFDMDHAPVKAESRIEVLARSPKREENWQPIALEKVVVEQSKLEQELHETRRKLAMPNFGKLVVGGIDFASREIDGICRPLLLGPGVEQLVIPINQAVAGVAVLGHVAFKGGYPASGVWSVHHGAGQQSKEPGTPAAEYEFVFEDGSELQPLQHGIHILRANNIARWWLTEPRAPETQPGVQAQTDGSFEIVRFDLWQRRFTGPRLLKEIRWRLKDADTIQAMLALSIFGSTHVRTEAFSLFPGTPGEGRGGGPSGVGRTS